jgi:Pectate lyase superfamily protein
MARGIFRRVTHSTCRVGEEMKKLVFVLCLLASPAWAQFATTTTTTPAGDSTNRIASTSYVESEISRNTTHFAAGGTTTGSANAQVITTTSPPNFTLTGNPTISFTAGFSNTSAMTLNTVSTGIFNVLKKTPAGLVTLVLGDVIVGQQYLVTYDGTQYELQEPSQIVGSQIAAATITTSQIAASTITGGNVASNTIANSNLVNMANSTVKCRTTAGTGSPEDCTQAQIAALALPIAAYDTLCNPTNASAAPIACQNGVLHSKDMGAVGNGSTDDTTALQNWINACQTNNLICFLDQGTYKITTALSVTSAIHIAGVGFPQAGSGGSIIQPATTISGINVVTTGPVNIHDIAVNYASAANTTTSAIILTASGVANLNTGSKIDHVNIVNAGNGFNIGQAQYWTVSNCLVQNIATGGTGMTMDNSALTNPDVGDSTITGCTFALPGSATGISITSFAGLRVVNNKIIGDSTASTAINYTLKNGITSSLLTIIGNSIESKTNGIVLQRAGTTGSMTNVIIASNEFEPLAGGTAVNNPTDANGVWLNNIMIHGNIIFGPTTSTASFGYIVKAASGVQITSNLTVSNSSTNGFQALATTGSNNCTLGPNGHGAGLFVASDLACTTVTTIAPN